ncbi:MAG: hypothetical protein V4550_14420 [Gemmatimonadota bacterium]
MKTLHITRRLLLATLALGSVIACQGGDIGAPTTLAPATASLDKGVFSAPQGQGVQGNAARCSSTNVISGSGVFGPAGGTLTFGDARLIIPGGALRDTVTISAQVVDPLTSHVEFSPHGLQFEKAAGLVYSQSCVLDPSGAPSVVYLSEDGNILETIPATYDPHWKTYAAAIWHFSGYAVAF